MAQFVRFRWRAFGTALLLAAAPGRSLSASQALVNLTEASAARSCVSNYTANVLPVTQVDPSEWNVEGGRVRDVLPANMPFQLVVGPNAEDRRMAETALQLATTSMPAGVRAVFTDLRLMGPMLQRIIRRCRPGVTNEESYVSSAAHPAVWRAADFNLPAIAYMARNLTSNSIPLIVSVRSMYEEYAANPIARATPLLDYPDPRPEVTFETPAGIAIVLRALENDRKFRFVASSWPVLDEKVSFAWVPLSTVPSPNPRICAIQEQWRQYPPAAGYGEIRLSRGYVYGRKDVAVFARYGDGAYGPPAIISFYVVPNERRTYGHGGVLTRIEYQKSDFVIPQLYQNKPWRDEYRTDEMGRIIGFTRLRTGQVFEDIFSAAGEHVVETYANDMPKVTKKVRYFTREDDPLTLDYEITSEEIRHPFGAPVFRTRGEYPAVRRRR